MNFIVKKLLKITYQSWFPAGNLALSSVNRRKILKHGLHAATATPVAISAMLWSADNANAQQTRMANQARPVVIAQIVDTSASQQDVSKDFLIGSSAAWQDINDRGGIRGRKVTHMVLETDGTPQGAQNAWQLAQNNPACLVLSGCTADPLAMQVNTLVRNEKSSLAHVAPWLQNNSAELAAQTFAIFSTREEQITHALKSLSTLNTPNLAVVFASTVDRQQNLAGIRGVAAKLKLQLQEKDVIDNLMQAGSAINKSTAVVILFVGGTPELAQFTQGLDSQYRQRYIIALADVNLQVLQQLGSMRNTHLK